MPPSATGGVTARDVVFVEEVLARVEVMAFVAGVAWSERGRRRCVCSSVEELDVDVLREKSLIYLGSKAIGDSGARVVGRALAAGGQVALNLDSCGIGDDGARYLAEGIAMNDKLEEISLFDNDIGSVGLAAICEAVCRPDCSVRVLSLTRNRIGIAGGSALGEMLVLNSSLATLYLMQQERKGGGIADEGAAAFAHGIAKNTGAFWFANVTGNCITDAGLDIIRQFRTEGKHTIFPVDRYPGPGQVRKL